MYAQDSIDLLTRSGIEFQKNEELGIDVNDFGELLMSSGVVLNSNIKWISFHSGYAMQCSILPIDFCLFIYAYYSYDFGYLLKLLTCTPLPAEETEFFELVHLYFPCIYDIKYLMKSCKNLKGGLNELAEDLEIERIGPQHQAGSDSLLTGATFFKMRKSFFENQIDDSKYMGILYGLTSSYANPVPHNPNLASSAPYIPIPISTISSSLTLSSSQPSMSSPPPLNSSATSLPTNNPNSNTGNNNNISNNNNDYSNSHTNSSLNSLPNVATPL